MGDIKARIKRMKELVDEGQWLRARELGQRVCADDPSNAVSKILLGKACIELGESDEATQNFITAVELQPKLVAAWQGLIACQTKFKKGFSSQLLITGYQKCLEALGDEEKFRPKRVELLHGYAEVLLETDSPERLPVLLELAKFATGYTFQEARLFAKRSIIRVLLPKKYEVDPNDLADSDVQLLLTTFDELLSEYDQTTIEQFYPQEHLNTLIKLNQVDKAVELCKVYFEKYQSVFALAFQCMTLLEHCLRNRKIDQADAESWGIMDELAKLDPQSPLVRIGKGFRHYLERNYVKSGDMLEKAVVGQYSIASLPAVYKLPITWTLESHAKKYLAISRISAIDDQYIPQAVTILQELQGQIHDWELFFHLGVALVRLGLLAEAEAVVEKGRILFHLDKPSLTIIETVNAYTALARKEYQTTEEVSGAALAYEDNNFFLHYALFRSLWDIKRRDPRRCILHLDRTLELNPGFVEAMLFKAFWVWRHENKPSDALSIYEKALSLRPNDPVVLKAVTNFMTLNRQDETAIQLLQKALADESIRLEDRRWMKLRVALLCYRTGKWDVSISYLKSAVLGWPENKSIKEFLGDALAFRGNYGSALGVFDDIIAKEDSFVDYSWYRRACVKQKLRLDTEAEEDFLRLKKESAAFRLLCYKSLAEIEIAKAAHAFERYLLETGLKHCQNAIVFCTESILNGGSSALTWTLLGDSLLCLRRVKVTNVEIEVDSFIWSGENQGTQIKLNIRQALYLASICYGVAVEMKRGSARLWERLALSYFYLGLRLKTAGDQQGCAKWMERSVLCIMGALRRNPHNPWIWNSAGLIAASSGICSHSDAARLHTRSLDLYSFFRMNPTVTADSWATLGCLFLNRKQLMPAHHIFKEAQSADPEHPSAWVGQAWIAEKSNLLLESLDLFRHACTMCLSEYAIVRYAEKVLWLLVHERSVPDQVKVDFVVRLQAVSSAVDFLSQYLKMHQATPQTLHVMCLLTEWMGLTTTGKALAQRAVQEIENMDDKLSAIGSQLSNMARINLARLMSATGCHTEAADLISSLQDVDPTLDSLLLLSLVHFNLGNYEDAENILIIVLDDFVEDPVAKSAVTATLVVLGLLQGNLDAARERLDSLRALDSVGNTFVGNALRFLTSGTLPNASGPMGDSVDGPVSEQDRCSYEPSLPMLFFETGYTAQLKDLESFVHVHPGRLDARIMAAYYQGADDVKQDMAEFAKSINQTRHSSFVPSLNLLHLTECSRDSSALQRLRHFFPNFAHVQPLEE